MDKILETNPRLAESITWAASKQTYYTIRLLVDRGRVSNAYRTYAYFRWVDDQIDQSQSEVSRRIAFVERQKALMESLYRGQLPGDLTEEEWMLANLVNSDPEMTNGLQTYIRNMMAVMVFDTYRRGRLISQKELSDYTRWLATAVTEAMHYFIGHNCSTPMTGERYLAVTAAHIVHMLRDTREDIAEGYFNIPREFLETHSINARDIDSSAYHIWVASRVQLARLYFKAGMHYMAQVENPRCRLAGYAYMTRFTGILDSIERNGYQLPSNYSGIINPRAALRLSWSALTLALK